MRSHENWIALPVITTALLSPILSFGFVLVSFAAGTAKHYELGSLYSYDYVLGLELNEPVSVPMTNQGEVKFPSTVGYKVLARVNVRPVWQNEGQGAILEISLKKPQLQIKSRKAPQPDGFRDHSSQLEAASMYPLFVHWKDGKVNKIYSVPDDDMSLVNVKKGIANLLQAELGSGTSTEESTPMGQCKVERKQTGRRLTKKFHGQCNQAEVAKFLISSHNSKALATDIESEVVSELTFNQETGTVEEAQVTEKHVVRTVAKQEVGATIMASQSFKLLETIPSSEKIVKASSSDTAVKELAKLNGFSLTVNTLMGEYEEVSRCDANTCKEYDSLSKHITSDNIASVKMASAFLQLVGKFRESSTEEILKLLKAGKRTSPVLLDACAAAGTNAAHKAAMKYLDFEDDEVIVKPERYLLGLSLAPSPPVEAVQDLFALVKKRVKSPQIQETLLLTTAAVINNVRINSNKRGSENTQVGSEFEEFVLQSLEACKEEALCKQIYLRALKNLKSPSTLSKLFEIVQFSDPKTSVVAMKAIHAFPDTAIQASHRPLLIKIVKQLGRKYDSSARTLALDMILRNNPTKAEVREVMHVIKQLDNPNHSEVSTFVWNRVQEFMEHNPALADYVKEIVKEEGLQTYHHLAPKGLSTAFTRAFTTNPKGNSTFSNAIEMTGKILKRSSFDVYLNTPEESLHLLSLGIFTGGLASFAGGDENAVEDADEPATAGMELSLMGVQLRPIVFFTGKGELMGLVWSGAGSERTPALQGNALLQDEKLLLRLYCGLVADINIQGGLSFELAGQIQISLWGRTANSLVENKAGLVLQSTIRVDTSFVKSRVDFTTASEAALHFLSDINFYDGVLMCMKLTQPEFVVKQNVHKTERIPGSKHKLRKAKYKTVNVPGITYALNRKNSEQCSIMQQNE